MARLILSAFTDEYADTFAEQLATAKRLHIDYIELRRADGKNVGDMTEADIARLSKMLSDSGVRVSSVGSPLGKIPADGDMRAHSEMAKRVFSAARILGAPYVRIFSFYPPQNTAITDFKARVYDYLSEIVALSQEYGVLPCHENEANIYGMYPERCLELLTYFRGKLGCVFDMGNFVLDGCDAWQAYETLKAYITYFHIKDALRAGAVVPAGCGEARIADILNDCRASAHGDAFITLEPHLQTFAGLNALVGKTFENPYKYPDPQTAFEDGYRRLKEIL